ncbi:MAG: hypothetical protein GPJ52_01855 [Candidatus Heimdallarchaeota archaeon]|nr:hypothetical protein [Candidatus Heimdallarchaeota archaeon]
MSKSVQMTLEGKKEKSKLCFGCMENERDLNIYAKVNIKTNPQYEGFELIEKKIVALIMKGKIAFCSQKCMGEWFKGIVLRIKESEK